MQDDVVQQLQSIKARNARVEDEKAWEVSLTRRSFIALVTYATAAIFLSLIKEPAALYKACVPVIGYWLSTVSLVVVKNWWIKNRSQKN